MYSVILIGLAILVLLKVTVAIGARWNPDNKIRSHRVASAYAGLENVSIETIKALRLGFSNVGVPEEIMTDVVLGALRSTKNTGQCADFVDGKCASMTLEDGTMKKAGKGACVPYVGMSNISAYSVGKCFCSFWA